MIHAVKCRSNYFKALQSGQKSFEVRKNDRDYKVGDLLGINEIDNGGNYTGKSLVCKINYILDDFEGLQKDYIVMSVSSIYPDTEF